MQFARCNAIVTGLESEGMIFAHRLMMSKTLTPTLATKANAVIIKEAFRKHMLIKVKTLSGQVVGPGYIAIMYGDVAFRMYSEPVHHGSHFFRIEEVAEIIPAHDNN